MINLIADLKSCNFFLMISKKGLNGTETGVSENFFPIEHFHFEFRKFLEEFLSFLIAENMILNSFLEFRNMMCNFE